MDLSNEYILMCEKAKEIQKLWKPTDTDFYYDAISKTVQGWCNICIDKSEWEEQKYLGNLIWLSRQDQLQSMLVHKSSYELFMPFFVWFQSLDVGGKYWSPEKLWLAFVMKEKYSKQWLTKDWIK